MNQQTTKVLRELVTLTPSAKAMVDLGVAALPEYCNPVPPLLTLTERELKEVKHALFYVSECNHGTVGHNQLVIIAKMATANGFTLALGDQGYEVLVPPGVEITS